MSTTVAETLSSILLLVKFLQQPTNPKRTFPTNFSWKIFQAGVENPTDLNMFPLLSSIELHLPKFRTD